MARSRKIVQIFFLLFFIFLFIKARYPYEVKIPSDIFIRISPLTPLFYFIDTLKVSSLFLPAMVILLLTPFLGRFFCGWICPLGTSLDITNKFIKAPSNNLFAKWSYLRWVKFGLLFMLIVLAVFSINLWSYLDPLSIFTRMTTVVFYPLFTIFSENLLIAGTKLPFLESTVYSIYDWYKNTIMPENQAEIKQVATILGLILLVFGLEKISRRFWCRNVCPAGALLGVLSQLRFYERIVGKSCPVCNKCQQECKMNAIPSGNIKTTNKVECIECFNCGDRCPPKQKSITYRFKFKPYYSQPDFSRRQFIGSATAGLAVLGLVGIGFPNRKEKSAFIRPPGALPENEFLDRCIRCLECVRICASNGRCLQPSGFNQSILDLWTPVAEMRDGYCEYNCNLCGQVCPTEAILPLPLEIKQKTPIGLAYFDKDLCIPFARHEDCIVCEEHCPTPDKAIKFDIKLAQLPDGVKRKVKYPYVVRDLCIGCGICEEKCPTPNKPGVFVIRENEKRFNMIPEDVENFKVS